MAYDLPKPVKFPSWCLTGLRTYAGDGVRNSGWVHDQVPEPDHMNELFGAIGDILITNQELAAEASANTSFLSDESPMEAEEGSTAGLWSVGSGIAYLWVESDNDGLRRMIKLETAGETDFNSSSPASANAGPGVRIDAVLIEADLTAKTWEFKYQENFSMMGHPVDEHVILAIVRVVVNAGAYEVERVEYPGSINRGLNRSRFSIEDGIAIGFDGHPPTFLSEVLPVSAMFGGARFVMGGDNSRFHSNPLVPPSNTTLEFFNKKMTFSDIDHALSIKGTAFTAASLASSVLTLGSDVSALGIGSIVEFTSGANSGTRCRMASLGSSVHLCDMDYEEITLTDDPNVNGYILLDRVTIKNVTFEGMSGITSPVIDFEYVNQLRLENCSFLDPDGAGTGKAIGWDNVCRKVEIRNCRFEGYDYDISCPLSFSSQEPDGWMVQGNSFSGNVLVIGDTTEQGAFLGNEFDITKYAFVPAAYRTDMRAKCRYTDGDYQTMTPTTDNIIDFDVKEWDYPKNSTADFFTTPEFTAYRNMKVQIKAKIDLSTANWSALEYVKLKVQRYRSSAWSDVADLDVWTCQATVANLTNLVLHGVATVDLATSEKLRIVYYHTNASNVAVNDGFLEVNEING